MTVMDSSFLVMLLTDRQESSVINFVAWIVIGMTAGLIAGMILNKTRYGLGRNVLLGIFGAIVGGFLANLLGKPGVRGLDLYSLVVAGVGAAVFTIVYQALFRRKRFLSMR